MGGQSYTLVPVTSLGNTKTLSTSVWLTGITGDEVVQKLGCKETRYSYYELYFKDNETNESTLDEEFYIRGWEGEFTKTYYTTFSCNTCYYNTKYNRYTAASRQERVYLSVSSHPSDGIYSNYMMDDAGSFTLGGREWYWCSAVIYPSYWLENSSLGGSFQWKLVDGYKAPERLAIGSTGYSRWYEDEKCSSCNRTHSYVPRNYCFTAEAERAARDMLNSTVLSSGL